MIFGVPKWFITTNSLHYKEIEGIDFCVCKYVSKQATKLESIHIHPVGSCPGRELTSTSFCLGPRHRFNLETCCWRVVF